MDATRRHPFDAILSKIRKESTSTVDLGERFEAIMLEFFKTDSIYKKRFEKVWMWYDWARENKIKDKMSTEHDLGIDIVAREFGGELCAIQCKCYADDNMVSKESINSFVAAGKSYKMSNYVFACTGLINNNAQAMLQGIRCNIITQEHLRNSSINWSEYPKIKPKDPKILWEYQQYAMNDVVKGFDKHSRGKMIMACGTGKTLVALKISEKLVGKGGTVLYLVPSISLILQSMREWSDNSNMRHYYMAVCSDKSVRSSENGLLTELEAPASTDKSELSEKMSKMSPNTMNVIFSTYNSIGVVKNAMRGKKFDLILCDEAHRTAGIGDKDNESFYTVVHHEHNIKSLHRLYMTATPRIYTDNVKGKAKQKEKEIISMDDEAIYGPVFHNLSFYDAVHKYHALSDFKVRVAIMDGDTMDKLTQKSISGDDSTVPLNERVLMTAVWHALEYPGILEEKDLLQRVIVFCDMINSSKIFAGESINYKKDIRENLEELAKAQEIDNDRGFVKLIEHIKKVKKDNDKTGAEIRHVDGGDNAQRRKRELDWLRDSGDDPDKCRILSNARCLSEGVDVPALDGIVFLNPRKSVVDIVQAVGRVMRKSPGKEFGYVVLPVAIPIGMKIDDALKDSKHFKIVWQVLNALRSHDPNLADEINRLILDKPNSNDNEITNRIIIRHAHGHNLYSPDMPADKMIDGITTKLIEKVGDVNYYDKYGKILGDRTHTIEAHLKNKIKNDDSVKTEIEKFHSGLKEMINDSVTEDATIQTISQHMVLARVFDELFKGEFSSHNPISVAFEEVISKIGLKEELSELDGFYEEVEKETSQIKTKDARQNFIKKIYGNFFESSDKKGTEQHGVVYTPIEVIDFIINSVQHVLKTEFGTEFNDRSVKVLEPFAGTGTFLVRLLESGYITTNMYEKYKYDLYANELILLAYYIATINIETTYSSLRNSGKYVAFDGISYTDTLRINSKWREGGKHRHKTVTLFGAFKIPYERISHQRGTHLHVVMGNPPYSVGQSDYNDQNQNIKYPEVDKRIENTYAQKTTSGAKNSLFDSYVRSIRWATDRIGDSGVIAFITNASFIHSDTASGIRASLRKEFTDVWCFDLRGNGRVTGDGRNIFEYPGQGTGGTRTPVSIVILVKNLKKKNHTIRYSRLENKYHSGQNKRNRVKELGSITGIKDWKIINPDRHHDWVEQRSEEFYKYVEIGNKDTKSGKASNAIFKMYSMGIGTSRDVWAYNSSKDILSKNMKQHIDYCNEQNLNNPKFDSTQAKWSGDLSDRLKNSKSKFNKNQIRISLYRPFFKQYSYFDKIFIHRLFQMRHIFPKGDSENIAIIIPDKGKSGIFSTIVTDITPDLHLIEQSQCFPLRIYDDPPPTKESANTLKTSSSSSRTNLMVKHQQSSQTSHQIFKSTITDNVSHSTTTRRVAGGENILDSTLQEYQTHYNDTKITKKDIFYYIYGLLHHEGYKKKFANSLSKEMPRIPMAPDFWKFSEAGQVLAYLHLNYETCKKYNLEIKSKFGKLEKMSFPKIKQIIDEVKPKQVTDKTKLKINGVIAFEDIPEIKYSVNGRTPLEWMIDRYRVRIDDDSKIINDSTAGMTEEKTTEMIQRLVYVGTESDKIIAILSKLPFEPKDWTPVKTGLDKHIDVKEYQSKI